MISKIDPVDMPGRATSYNNLVEKDIREFIESDWTVAEVKTEKYKNVHSAFSAYKAAAKRLAPDHVVVSERSGRLFLIRKVGE